MQPVLSGQRVEVGVVVFASSHGGGGIDDAEQGEVLIALDDLLAPVGQFEGLVEEQNLPAHLNKVAGEVHEFPSLEVEGVHVGIETLSHAGIEVVLGIREEELCAAYSAGSANANQSIAPVD